MDSITAFLTSKTGAFAALIAVLALAALLHGVIRPYLIDRRDSRRDRAWLQIAVPEVAEVVSWANSCDLRFTVTNSGGRPAILRSLRLRVNTCEPSSNSQPTRTAAPITVYQHRAELAPGVDLVDIRKRNFGKQLQPLNFDKGETAAFLVKLVSRTPHRYGLRVEALWYDSENVSIERLTHTEYVTVDFPKKTIPN